MPSMNVARLPGEMARRALYAAQVLRTQWKSREEIEEFQLKRLKYIVDHAYRNTILYHRKFREEGIYPSDIHSLKDIKKIPLTTKDEMRLLEESMAKGYSPQSCHTHVTSGSSGAKLRIYYNMSARDRYYAFMMRYTIGAGMKPWYKYAVISHLPDDRPGFRLSQFSRTIPIPGHLDAEKKVALFKKIQPDVTGGHPCTMLTLAKQVEKEGLNFQLKFILVGGELSTPEERQYIEDIFRCPTFDRYGSFELRSMGWECKQHTMHVEADNNIVEFLKDGEDVTPGESGEVVGTNLWNIAMPFIRYQLGDIASPSDDECQCGRGLPTFSLLQGRRDDFIVAEGILIPPTRVVPLFFPLNDIDGFQVIQEDLRSLRVKIVKGKGFSHQTLTTLHQNLKNVVGDSMEIIIEECEEIKEDREKMRAVISNVEKVV